MMFDLLPHLNPGLVFILAGLLCVFSPSHFVRKALMIAAPIAAGMMIFQTYDPLDTMRGQFTFAGIDFTTVRIDRLSMVWGYVFCLAGLINGIFAFHEKCKISDSCALLYTGAAIGAVFAGDLITLFMFWELTAISSVFLVWRGGPASYAAGMRYLGWHVLSGVLLLAGAIIYGRYAGNYEFNNIGLNVPGGLIMMIGIGIKAGFPFLHTWITDAYPKSSVTGTVVLATFSTKMAIYALARGWAGTEVLIYIGVIMTLFPLFYAAAENDLRKVLAHMVNNQLGFMVVGVGVGSAMALNGVAGQVAVGVIFKSLLFMSMGAVLHRVGTAKASELGGLFRSMPLTTLACLIGAASIVAVPLFAGFVTKAMILSSVYYNHNYIVLFLLLCASAGVMHHNGIKLPFFAFFGEDSGRRVKEAPTNMLLAMGIACAFCLVLAWPAGGYQMLYALLPEPEIAMEYAPYTANHVLTQLQLLLAALFAFAAFRRFGRYPQNKRAQILDVDYLWRKPGLAIAKWADGMMSRYEVYQARFIKSTASRAGKRLYQVFSPAGSFSQDAPSGVAALMTASILALALFLVYFIR